MTSTLIHSQNYSQSSHYFISVLCLSDSALRLVDLSSGDINSSKFDGSSSSKCIKSLLAKIESVVCVVDCCHKDGFALECKLPAGATLCRVPPWNGSSTADVREVGEGSESTQQVCRPVSKWPRSQMSINHLEHSIFHTYPSHECICNIALRGFDVWEL